MNKEVLWYLLVLLFWIVAIDKTRASGWWPRDAGQRANCLALLLTGLIITLSLPPVWLRIDVLTGVPNITMLIVSALAVFTAWSFQPCVEHLLNLPRSQRGIIGSAWFALAVTATASQLFILAPLDQTANYDFTGQYGGSPFVLEYLCVLALYLILAVWRLFIISWQYSRVASAPQALRWRFRCYTIGWGLTMLVLAHECMHALFLRLDLRYPPPGPAVIKNVLLVGSLSMLMSGGLFDLYRWHSQYRAYRRLYPLWDDLYKSIPSIALLPPHSTLSEVLTTTDLKRRLYRRITEIRDGIVALRAYMDRAIAEEVALACDRAGIVDQNTRGVITDAALIAAAIRAKESGRRRPGSASEVKTTRERTIDGSQSHLEKVAQEYRNSHIVRAYKHPQVTGGSLERRSGEHAV